MLLNFDAGPAALPKNVLEEAAKAIIDYENTGLSILELPHRGTHFGAILEEANQLVKEILNIGDDYAICWMQGGGRHQFSMIPQNFLGPNDVAGYFNSGHWSYEAIKYALYYGKVHVLGDTMDCKYIKLPKTNIDIDPNLAYLHITSNNTIYGTQFQKFPTTSVPIIADMSSDIFSRRIDVSKFAMIYAVAQKNIGPAGVTMVIIKKEFAKKYKRILPEINLYNEFVLQNSMINTPPVFAIYASLLNLRVIKERGLENIEKENELKSNLLYYTLEVSKLYKVIPKAGKSKMNVCFDLRDKTLEQQLIDYATSRNIIGISGHRSVGGFRVSLYNTIRLEDVKYLCQVLKDFEKNFYQVQ